MFNFFRPARSRVRRRPVRRRSSFFSYPRRRRTVRYARPRRRYVSVFRRRFY
jgi:hypothetical protein